MDDADLSFVSHSEHINLPIDIFENFNSNNSFKMSVQELKSCYLDMVPAFSGEPELLANFLEVCGELINQFYDRANPDNFQNRYLIRSILAKIKGRAAELIIGANCTTWENIRVALTAGYADKRDLYTITIEMTELKQNADSAFSYLEKVRKHLNLAVMFLKNNAVPNSDQQILFFQQLALRVFLRGLKEPLGSLLQSRKPTDLDAAHGLLTNDFQYYSTRQNTNNNRPPQGTQFSNRPQNQNYQPQTQIYKPQNQNYQPTTQHYKPQSQQRPPPRPQLQVQNYQPPTQHYKPQFPQQTPMSGVQTIRQQPTQQFHSRLLNADETDTQQDNPQDETELPVEDQEENYFLEQEFPDST